MIHTVAVTVGEQVVGTIDVQSDDETPDPVALAAVAWDSLTRQAVFTIGTVQVEASDASEWWA